MKRISLFIVIVLVVTVSLAFAQGFRNLRATLIGFEEVAAVSTVASGNFNATINAAETEIAYSFSYANLEGNVQQAHIHLGQRSVNGGISVFLCSNLGNGPAGTQACPPPPATITGTIIAADVSPNIPATAAARAQGLNTGDFAELVRAIRAGKTYANVHSDKFPGGEARGQIRAGGGHEDHGDDD